MKTLSPNHTEEHGVSRRRRAAAKHAKHRMKVGAREKAEVGLAKIVEDLSRTYGYALLGCTFNAIYILCVSSLPLTKWFGDGTVAGGEGAVPGVDKWVWGLGFWGGWNSVVAVLCTFVIAQGSPFPLPGKEIDSWDCALLCFFSMLLSGWIITGIAYLLPLSQGASPEFYYLDVIPIALNFTVGIVVTRLLMRAYLEWMQKRGQTGTQHDLGESRHAEKKKINTNEKSGIWKETVPVLNGILLIFMAIGCESLSKYAQDLPSQNVPTASLR